jgi:uncharacterized protein YrrD
MSLQTGGKLAHTEKAIINPANLQIVAFEVSGTLLTEKPSFLRIADIREYGRLGMIIDSTDELVGLDDVIQIERLYKQNFSLIGMQVIDESGHKLGKIDGYTVETDDFIIQQINVKKGIFGSFNDTGHLIHRSQIVEINYCCNSRELFLNFIMMYSMNIKTTNLCIIPINIQTGFYIIVVNSKWIISSSNSIMMYIYRLFIRMRWNTCHYTKFSFNRLQFRSKMWIFIN